MLDSTYVVTSHTGNFLGRRNKNSFAKPHSSLDEAEKGQRSSLDSWHAAMNLCCHEPCLLQVFNYYRGGADSEATVRDNRAVYSRYKLLPSVMRDVSQVDASTSFLGKPYMITILDNCNINTAFTLSYLADLP